MSADSESHPIDAVVRVEIEHRLRAIEVEHGVRVLYVCESGSRGWGFASPDSDYDVRFIYVHPLPWYLQVSVQRDVIEQPISDLLDINGWELRKALGLLKRGNATLIEWLDSPVAYRAESTFIDTMRAAAGSTYRPERSFHHYLHMARKNHREYLQGERVRLKKYLYVLRPLLACLWVVDDRGLPPMRFEALVDAMVDDVALRADIDALLVVKRAALESEYGEPWPAINAFIECQLQRLEAVQPLAVPDADFTVLDDVLR